MRITGLTLQAFGCWGRLVLICSLLGVVSPPWRGAEASDAAPVPLLESGRPVTWWFAFKFNSASFPACEGEVERVCSFGGEVQDYTGFSQQFVYASSRRHSLKLGTGCLGDDVTDPIGATFEQIYRGSYNYVVWNDQFYGDPNIVGCGNSCSSPWGHAKGMVAWNDSGDGLVLQTTTPSWPAAASENHPRPTDGNTLGCIENNNVKFSQHFLAIKLSKADLLKVLHGLSNASVVTDLGNPQIVQNGGPADIQATVQVLGTKSTSETATLETLSTGIKVISKPSRLHVPPWQLASAMLGGVSLRTATWWANPRIPSADADASITCWDDSLEDPGPVEIATSGAWENTEFGLKGGQNHAKLGVSVSGDHHYAIFGDLNQQGTIDGANCASSQNGRGGLFFVIDDAALWSSLSKLISGETAAVGSLN